MKKFKKITLLLGVLAVLANNSYATTEEVASNGNYTKYLFMGVAALVIILLLFLGYKMDSKGGDDFKVSKSSKKSSKKGASKHQIKTEEYIADTTIYESDIVSADDIKETIEYEEDEEQPLFEYNNEDTSVNNYIEETEEYGEEFDTSIIDSIDDDIDVSNNNDETISFNPATMEEVYKSTVGNIESVEEIEPIEDIEAELDKLEPEEEVSLEENESDPFIDSLKNFKEPEIEFSGFSVANSKKEEEKIIEEQPKKSKNKEEDVSDFSDIPVDTGFLEQMEKNLEKNQKEREAKKATPKKTGTRKKKTE